MEGARIIGGIMSDKKSTNGRFVWHDLTTTDPAAAVRFYSELFGWTTKEEKIGEGNTYTMLFNGKTGIGGITKPQHGEPAHWLAYATTNDCDAAAQRIARQGGKVLLAPTDIPNVGRFSIFNDEQGAHLAVINLQNETTDTDDQAPVHAFCW